MTQPGQHVSVLLAEAVQALAIRPDGTYVDATFGRGGHSRAILAQLGPQGRLIALDRDPQAIAAGAAIEDTRLVLRHAAFSELSAAVGAAGAQQVDGVLLDLGVSSPQLDDPQRGMSFRFDAPLDMRMDTTRGITAAQWLAQADVKEIKEVLRDYGEERFADAIAKAVVAARAGRPVETTRQFAALVEKAVRTREPGLHPATRSFQALRILVNQELEELSLVLPQAVQLLAPGGRLAAISFHSLEDRIVKTFIARESRAEVDRRAPFAEPKPTRLRAVARIKPSEAEIAANPRARSAILRVAERTAVA